LKRIVGITVATVFAAISLVSCGGGGGTSATPTPTPTGTPVSMTTFKGIYYGTVAPGTQASANLSGSDSQGFSWTGSFTAVSDGPTTFETQNVTKSRTLVTLQRGTGTPITGISSRYFLISNSTLYKSVSSLGTISVPTTQTIIPNTIHVGDFDNFLNTTNSDGTTTTSTWEMEGEFNGNTKFIASAVFKTGGTITSTEVDTYFLDPSGKPYRIEISVTVSGVTVNLSGNFI